MGLRSTVVGGLTRSVANAPSQEVGVAKSGLRGKIKGALINKVRGDVRAPAATTAAATARSSANQYRPIPIPDYNSDMQRYYQMTNDSVPAVQRMNPGMIQRNGYQGPTFANDRPQTPLQRPPRGMSGYSPIRSSGPRPMMPNGGLRPQMQPAQNMSLNPNAGSTGGMIGPRPMMLR